MAKYEQIGCFASLPKTVRGKALAINGDPKNGKNMLYTNGNNVFIRDIENPCKVDIYTDHSSATTCAKYSPSGFYIASGDESGKVRVWDTVNAEHVLKKEHQPISGEIRSIAWTADSQKIAVGGEGREKYGHVFRFDDGSSVGTVTGHGNSINAVDLRPERPFRLITASEDNNLVFHEGPPFKFKFSIQDHKNFVNAVRYSPKGDIFISGGSDKRAFIYDGKTAEKIGELGSPAAHSGGIYALCFNDDGTQVLTASGDKTAKIFNVPSGELVTTFEMGKMVDDMQLGCLWQGENLITVSLSGYINFLDKDNPSKPRRIIKGHNKAITAMAVSGDTIYTGGMDGRLIYWNAVTGENEELKGTPHKNQIQDMVTCDGELITVGMDDKIIFSDESQKQYGDAQGLDSQPKSVCAVGGTVVVACVNHVIVFKNRMKSFAHAVNYEPTCVAIHPSGSIIAVSGGKDKKVHICEITSGAVTETQVLDFTCPMSDMQYSPSGEYLAMAGADRYVKCFRVENYQEIFSDPSHTARPTCLDWAPDSSKFATGGLDQNLVVWDPTSAKNNIVIKGAHRLSHATRVRWLDTSILLSCSHDCNVKQWRINLSATK